MPNKHTCGYCGKSGISTLKGLWSHTTQWSECWKAAYWITLSRVPKAGDSDLDTDSGDKSKSTSSVSHDEQDIGMTDTGSPLFNDNIIQAEYDLPMEDNSIPSPLPTENKPSSRKATVEDVNDDEEDEYEEETHWWIHDFPKPAGVPLSQIRQETVFERIQWEQQANGEDPWSPYIDVEEWELVHFMNQTLGHNDIEKYLRLPIICVNLPYSQCSVLNLNI